MNDNELDKLFSEQLKNRPSKPSAKVWDNIEAELDRKEKTVQVHRLNWLKYAAVALAALGTSTWWYLQQPGENNLAQQATPIPQKIERAQQVAPLEKTTEVVDATAIVPNMGNRLAGKLEKPVLKAKKDLQSTSNLLQEETEKPAKNEQLILASMPLNKPSLTLTDDINEGQNVKRRVVEIAPIRPLVDLSEDDTESMLAFAPEPTESVVTGILNKISDVIVSDDQKKPRFSRDDEGSFRIDFNNNFAKNKFKRRK